VREKENPISRPFLLPPAEDGGLPRVGERARGDGGEGDGQGKARACARLSSAKSLGERFPLFVALGPLPIDP